MNRTRIGLLSALLAGTLLVGAVAPALAQGYPPPPAMREEVVPPPPPIGPIVKVWRPGFWDWNGHAYVWRPGRYVRAVRPGAEWVPAHWEDHHGRWVWKRGHWQ